MKLVTGLTLVSVAFGNSLQYKCNNVADMANEELLKYCNSRYGRALAKNCENESLVAVPLSICPDDSDISDDNAIIDTIDSAQLTWVNQVLDHCKEDKQSCKKKASWSYSTVKKLQKFKEALDGQLQAKEIQHFKEYMDIANQRCFVRTKHCPKEIKKVGDLEYPSHNNGWKKDCIQCFVISMNSAINVYAGDTALAGIDGTNCLGKFCKDLEKN